MSGKPTSADFSRAFDQHWHNRPPASLEDVMALYGLLAVVESGGELFRTPSKLEPFVDDGRLVTISIDLTDKESKVDDIEQDVLREEDTSKLAYSHKSSGRGAKYSLTQIGSKNGNDAEGVSSTIIGRFRSWTTQDSVQSLTGEDGHPDGWIIEELADIFQKDSETLKKLKSTVRSVLPAEDSIPTAVTVRLRLDGAAVESVNKTDERWFWPAEIGVLDAATRRYATANATDKNISSGSSKGQGVGLVTGEEGRVVGTPESPLDVFSVKHPDEQPGLRQDQSWRSYPISGNVAMLLNKSVDMIERCVYRDGGMETYALPYFAGEVTGMKAEALYLAIESVQREEDGAIGSNEPPMAQVTFNLREHERAEIRELAERELRFYTVTMPISDDKHIITESPAAESYWVSEVADALVTTLRGPTLNPRQGGFDSSPNWPLIEEFPTEITAARKRAFGRIVGHEFTNATFAYREDEGDDFRRIVDHRIMSGQQLEASTLFDEYVRRYSDAAEDGEAPSYQVVAQQLVHFETLTRAGLVQGIDKPITANETAMTSDFTTDSIDSIRQQRMERFLNRPMFEDATRRAAALAGMLVGEISWHQDQVRDIGRPLDSKVSGDQLSKNSLERAITSALENAKLYAQESDYASQQDLLFPETVDKLLSTTEKMPTEWEIDKREMQFCYVLGHAHGRRSMPVAFDLLDEDSSTETESAEESTAN